MDILAELITQARQKQSFYTPNDMVRAHLQHKNMIMFVAPAATGKTFVMNKIAAMNDAFGRVPVFTTRPPRADDDPGMFRTMPYDEAHVREILQKIDQGSLVQYVVHPAGWFYGSEVQDYPAEYNMLATLSGAVHHIAQLPFRRVFIVGVVTEVKEWEAWLNERFPAGSSERIKRLHEAIDSLTWLLNQPAGSLIWVNNKPGQIDQTARKAIDAILYNKRTEDAIYLAEKMLRRAKEMV